jgi:tRNA(Met) C34 N-acetyltransferase TmcA
MSSVINKEIEAYLAIRNRLDFYKVAELLNFTPHAGQKCIFDTLNDGNFETLIATLGRRFGKTTAIGKIAAGELLCPFASVLIIAPTTQNAKVLFSQVYQDILALNLKIDTKDLKGMTFTLKNGGRLQVVTGNNY